MKKIITKQFLHDYMLFYYTDEAIDSDKEIIGFYFDRLGFPQSIHRKSFYGGHILKLCGGKTV